MTAIQLKFLANRYHGTAWGRHVNEGMGEWPPSPYRLLRAMYDTWKRKCCDLTEEEVRAVFEALARQAPEFHLPKAVASHTRSYLHKNTGSASDKALVFDGFIALPKDARCVLRWDVDLSLGERRNLQLLLASLNFLGRSESWVEAALTDRLEERPNWTPLPECARARNLVKVACPLPASAYRLRHPDWLNALAISTSELSKKKMSGPPAMSYVPYDAPADALTTWLPAPPSTHRRHVSAALLELSGKVLPPITETVRVAERVRGRLMRYFEQNHGTVPWMVHGKEEDETPRKDHNHLFILPRANRLGRIDHILVHTRHHDGFTDGLLEALANLHTIRWVDEKVNCVLSWAGHADDAEICPSALKVKSSTPFVTVRHWREGRDHFLEDEVRRECKNHGLPQPIRVQNDSANLTRFRRNRDGDPSRPGYSFQIDFDTPVRTPFSLGYASHFGLGQFEAL